MFTNDRKFSDGFRGIFSSTASPQSYTVICLKKLNILAVDSAANSCTFSIYTEPKLKYNSTLRRRAIFFLHSSWKCPQHMDTYNIL